MISKQDAHAMAQPADTVVATPGPNSGQIMLTWNQTGGVQKYSLVFGHSAGNYNMGLVSFPTDTRSMTVNHMVPGQRYFFQIWSYDDPNGPEARSMEVSATAK